MTDLMGKAFLMHDKNGRRVFLFMYGDQICAVRDDFINLMESNAGFGFHPEEAIADLLINEAES